MSADFRVRWQVGSGRAICAITPWATGSDQVKKLSLKAKLWINCGSLLLILLLVGGIALKTALTTQTLAGLGELTGTDLAAASDGRHPVKNGNGRRAAAFLRNGEKHAKGSS